jgi:hypothetical protein
MPYRIRRSTPDRTSLVHPRALLAPVALAVLALAVLPRPIAAQASNAGADSGRAVPSPRDVLGFEVGADRTLADWGQITGYYAKVATTSRAVKVDTLGPTTEGRPLVVATISTPANLRRLEEIRRNQARLADPRVLSADEEAQLVATQPAVVMIQCNIHSTEIASSQMSMELAYRLATNDTLQRALADVVVLLVPSANPDGEQMVTEWYRQGLGTPWEGGPLPRIYHHYTGHDNNRDWFMVTQRETRLLTNLLYRRWFPEVMYDVHQQGSAGMRLTVPPYVDPIDPNIDPLLVREINHIGAEMSLALEERGKSGVGDGATYDLWWHGGARSVPYRHNTVGILTEAASVKIATPITQRREELTGHPRGLPIYERRVSFPNPWPGGSWRLRDIVDYELIASEALVRMMAQQREEYVRNFVHLARRQVRLGETEAPYAYVVPAGQRDPAANARLAEVLRVGGVEVDSLVAPTTLGGRPYPAGSLVVRLAQPYRAHAKDLLEAQHYPAIARWPGGPVERPYDVTGWTLPLQMGVEVAAVDVPLPAALPLAPRTDDRAAGAVGTGARCRRSAGRARGEFDARDTGCYRQALRALRSGRRVRFRAPGSRQPIDVARMPRVALYKPWTANIDEGWTRWVLEEFGFPYVTVTDSAVKAGRLRDQFDVVLVSDVSLREARDGMSASQVPPRYAGGLGVAGLDELKKFATAGGTLVLLDHAAEIATGALGVPLSLVTVPPRADDEDAGRAGAVMDAAKAKDAALYAPGSILRVLVDATHPVGAGMADSAAVYFTNSVTFDVPTGPGGRSPARVIARYPARGEDILLSGYLQGASAIAGKAAAVDVPVGQGKVILFGFRPQYRGQAYGTFKMLFNALLTGGERIRRW